MSSHDTTENTLFGFWIYLMTDCIMFATFFAAYAVLHTGANQLLNLPFALIATLVLLTSSVAHGIALLYKKQLFFWLGVTFACGLLFVSMECMEFNSLITKGHTWDKSAALSSYFTLIGVHTLHVIAGLFMMIVLVIQAFFTRLNEVVWRRLTCLKIYWHFLYLIWIFTFAIVYLLGAK